MKTNRLHSLFLIGALLIISCGAMAFAAYSSGVGPTAVLSPVAGGRGIVTLTGRLAQEKIVKNGDGTFAMSLVMKAEEVLPPAAADSRQVDMVLVLDRSGSMQGEKMEYACQAILELLDKFNAADRLALVTYNEEALGHTGLLPATAANRQVIREAVQAIVPRGGTNLGAGLSEGTRILTARAPGAGSGRVLLISDGLANHGITDPVALGRMADEAGRREITVSTVGVGLDFNEALMTRLADAGTGNYTYLENATAFAATFKKELDLTRQAAATAIEVRVPLLGGMSVLHASGYPIAVEDGQAVIRPSNLLSGETRELFLTCRLPADQENTSTLSGISVSYRHQGRTHRAVLAEPLIIACVADEQAAMASIDKDVWEAQVIKEDYNRLRQEVAAAVKGGEKAAAVAKIEQYRQDKEKVNALVGSESVADNLVHDVEALRSTVEEVFTGPAPLAEEKQKKSAKELQYQGYEGRRQNSFN